MVLQSTHRGVTKFREKESPSTFLHSIVPCRKDEGDYFSRNFVLRTTTTRHSTFHRCLFPFSSKFPDINFAPYVLYIYSCYMKPVRDTNSEPGLPVHLLEYHTCTYK